MMGVKQKIFKFFLLYVAFFFIIFLIEKAKKYSLRAQNPAPRL